MDVSSAVRRICLKEKDSSLSLTQLEHKSSVPEECQDETLLSGCKSTYPEEFEDETSLSGCDDNEDCMWDLYDSHKDEEIGTTSPWSTKEKKALGEMLSQRLGDTAAPIPAADQKGTGGEECGGKDAAHTDNGKTGQFQYGSLKDAHNEHSAIHDTQKCFRFSNYLDENAGLEEAFQRCVVVRAVDKAHNASLRDSCVLKNTGFQLLEGAKLAAKVRQQIELKTGYTCSAGIAHSKLMSKIGSTMNKPAGMAVVPSEYEQALLETMPIRKIPLLGGKRGDTLENMHDQHRSAGGGVLNT
jgi:hypothetical protein